MTKFLRTLALMTALGVTVAATGTMAQDKKPADTKKEDKEAKTGKVEIFEGKDGAFRFRVLGTDGKSISTSSKGYKTKDDCVKAFDELKAIVAKVKPVDAAK